MPVDSYTNSIRQRRIVAEGYAKYFRGAKRMSAAYDEAVSRRWDPTSFQKLCLRVAEELGLPSSHDLAVAAKIVHAMQPGLPDVEFARQCRARAVIAGINEVAMSEAIDTELRRRPRRRA